MASPTAMEVFQELKARQEWARRLLWVRFALVITRF